MIKLNSKVEVSNNICSDLLAQLVGLLNSAGEIVGERYITIDIPKSTISQIKPVVEKTMGNSFYGSVYTHEDTTSKEYIKLIVDSEELVNYLRESGLLTTPMIPNWISKGTSSTKRSFLRGVFEGDKSNTFISIVHLSRSKDYTIALHRLLMTLGIFSLVDTTKHSSYGEHRLSIPNLNVPYKFIFYRDIGYISSKGDKVLLSHSEADDYRTFLIKSNV